MNRHAMMGTDRPLEGKRVLVTRARRDAAVLTHMLEAQGATVIELPVIAIEPPADTTALDDALSQLSGYDWIAFASQNAVSAVVHRLEALGLPRSIPAGVSIAAVGPSTAQALSELGLAVDCFPSEAGAKQLLRKLSQLGVRGKRILLPLGDLSRQELPEGLQKAGAEVREVVAYRTTKAGAANEEALAALRSGAIGIVTFASPSAVRHLLDLLGNDRPALNALTLVCIGPTTAAAIEEAGLNPSQVAARHTMPGLVQAVIQAVGAGAVA